MGADEETSFSIIGITMVVDQLGKGARVVLRYPLVADAEEENVFHQLPEKQLAKLFRPTPELCGQPMTLSIDRTVFCCCAVLNSEAETDDHLSLFSVIVALAANDSRVKSLPIAGWLEDSKKVSASFFCMRRVHISLSRVCRVLEREERRCSYVSTQTNLLETIRHEISHRKYDLQLNDSAAPPPPPTTTPPNTAAASPASIISKTTTVSRHRRVSSHNFGVSFTETTQNQQIDPNTNANILDPEEVLRQQQLEQEILETMLVGRSTKVTVDDEEIEHHGNIARELIDVYHALARNDHRFEMTPDRLLSNDDGIVYINRHIAVPIEAVVARQTVQNHPVRPYHTLLFPNASAHQLLESLYNTTNSRSVAPRRLQQLLRHSSTRKSLLEMGQSANLPLQKTLEMASYLVKQGCCVVSPVITRKIKLAVTRIQALQENALAFGQKFGRVDLFVLVSVLAVPGRTLGEALVLLKTSSDETTTALRGILEEYLPEPGFNSDHETTAFDDLDELVHRMVVWLCAHSVVVVLQDYVVSVRSETPNNDGENKSDNTLKIDNLGDELLIRQLQSLKGKVSVPAACWKFNMEQTRLIGLVVRNSEKLRIITRVPEAMDDFNHY